MVTGTFPSLPYVYQYDTREDILQLRTRREERVKGDEADIRVFTLLFYNRCIFVWAVHVSLLELPVSSKTADVNWTLSVNYNQNYLLKWVVHLYIYSQVHKFSVHPPSWLLIEQSDHYVLKCRLWFYNCLGITCICIHKCPIFQGSKVIGCTNFKYFKYSEILCIQWLAEVYYPPTSPNAVFPPMRCSATPLLQLLSVQAVPLFWLQ